LYSWKSKFIWYNQEWLREAIQLVYHKFNADNPKPKWLEDCFKEVKAGKQGKPLDESSAAAREQNQKAKQYMQEKELADYDRNSAYNEVKAWDPKKKAKWAKRLNDFNPMFSNNCDPLIFSSWSKTYCQFVKVFRDREKRLAND
jgi:hypothetical protein